MSKLKAITLNDIELDFIEEMKEKNHWRMADTLHRALDDFRKKHTTPDYVLKREKAIDLKTRVLEATLAGKKVTARELKTEDRGKVICEQMGATIVGENRLPDPNGGYCLYNTYQCHRDDTRILTLRNPLEYLTADMVETQYSPDRSTYEKFCKENNLNPTSL